MLKVDGLSEKKASDNRGAEHLEAASESREATAASDDVIEHDAAATLKCRAVEINDVGIFHILRHLTLVDGETLAADANGAEAVDAATQNADFFAKSLVSGDVLHGAAGWDADESEVMATSPERLAEVRCDQTCYNAAALACLEVPNKISHCPLIFVCLVTSREVLIECFRCHSRIVFFISPRKEIEAFFEISSSAPCVTFFLFRPIGVVLPFYIANERGCIRNVRCKVTAENTTFSVEIFCRTGA